jgi:hypothetical protein
MVVGFYVAKVDFSWVWSANEFLRNWISSFKKMEKKLLCLEARQFLETDFLKTQWIQMRPKTSNINISCVGEDLISMTSLASFLFSIVSEYKFASWQQRLILKIWVLEFVDKSYTIMEDNTIWMYQHTSLSFVETNGLRLIIDQHDHDPPKV